VQIVVRTHSEKESALLQKEKIDGIFFGEHELARSMTQYVLDRYGAETDRHS
jgi:CPA2 family monovalent cation:H+ antiporter-2